MNRASRFVSAAVGVAAASCLLLGSLGAARAAPPEDAGAPAAGKKPGAPTSTQDGRRPRGKAPRIENLEEMVIEGRVPKPQPTVITQRASMKYRRRPLKRTFVDRIVHSVDEPPF